jgi:chondroitin AC lyase
MGRTLLTVLVFALSAARPAAAAAPDDSDLATVEQRVEVFTIAAAKRGDRMGEIGSYVQRMTPEGAWPDINYESNQRGGWPTADHLRRLLPMAAAWKAKGAPRQESDRLRRHVARGLAHWLDRDLDSENWIPNWWYDEIFIPRTLGKIGLLMDEALPDSLRQPLLRRTAQAEAGDQGQNWVWKSEAALLHGLLSEDAAHVDQQVANIFRELRLTTGEGLQHDWSFQQHGPQFQMGNYGLHYAYVMTRWLWATRGTSFTPPRRKRLLMRRYLLRGQAWEVYRGSYDLNGAGRHIKDIARKPPKLARALERMAAVDTVRRGAYRQALQSIRAPEAPNPLAGNQWFWRSEVMVHRRPGWMVSLKMTSTRTVPNEVVNDEGVLSGLFGLGSAFLYTDGRGDGTGDYEQIPRVWNWRRIPGTTAGRSAGSLGAILPWEDPKPNTARFSGGVSDGRIGAAAMAMRPADHKKIQPIRSRKSWFFFSGAYVALGRVLDAGLSDEVLTTLTQQGQDAPPVVWGSGGDERVLSPGTAELSNPRAVVHDETAYVFPNSARVVAHRGAMTGNWYRAYRKPEQPQFKEKATRDVFMLAVSHGPRAEPRPALRSIVLPTGGAEAARSFMEDPWLEVLRNDRTVQAVQSEKTGVVQAAFFEAGTLALDDETTLRVSSPAMLMLRPRGAGYDVYLSDPLKAQPAITFSLDGTYMARASLQSVPVGVQAAVDAGRTRVTADLPGGGASLPPYRKPAAQRLADAMPRLRPPQGRTVALRLTEP